MIKTIWKGINKIFQKLHRKTPKFMITSYLIKTNKKKDLNFIFASLAFTIFAAVGLHSIVIKYTFLIRLRKIVFLYTYLVFFFFYFLLCLLHQQRCYSISVCKPNNINLKNNLSGNCMLPLTGSHHI